MTRARPKNAPPVAAAVDLPPTPAPKGIVYRLKRRLYRVIAAEISSAARFFDAFVQWRPLASDSGILFSLVEASQKSVATEAVPVLKSPGQARVFLVNGNLNHEVDAQDFLKELKSGLTRADRVCLVTYNSYLNWMYRLLGLLEIRKASLHRTFLTREGLHSIARLEGFEVTRTQSVLRFPIPVYFNGWVETGLRMMPWMRFLAAVEVTWLRPVLPSSRRPSLSILIPARNERGNLSCILERLACLEGTSLDVIFVEGHSSDGTWEEIQKIIAGYRGRFTVRAFQQKGKGKRDAVRLGFEKAMGDLVTILDADLTTPPEMLPKFFEAYLQGHGDFLNGNRMLYPMEPGSMRFLNQLGNVFFAKALSVALDTPIGDSLCGSKLISREHYRCFRRWNEEFGEFDPFGDFELLYPAAALGIGITDVPVAYKARTYGATNIRRFRHGFQLLRMVLVGLFSIKIGRRR